MVPGNRTNHTSNLRIGGCTLEVLWTALENGEPLLILQASLIKFWFASSKHLKAS